MKSAIRCINQSCLYFGKNSDDRTWIRPHGTYRRKCDSKTVNRFRCTACGKTFSNQTFNATYRQHRPRINLLVKKLFCTKNSMRDIAREHGINRKTVHRRMLWCAEQARIRQKTRLQGLKDINFIQMDEMETFEHTKCKPISIAVIVVPGTRHILAAITSEMPAKGPLAEISRKKYGLRRDERETAFGEALSIAKPCLTNDVWIATDKKTTYPNWIKKALPDARHFRAKGRRGCIVGYGEMKKGGFDPLFWINHAAATIRDKIARMLRRTWCSTKFRRYLQDKLDILIDFFNEKRDACSEPLLNREHWLISCQVHGVLQ